MVLIILRKVAEVLQVASSLALVSGFCKIDPQVPAVRLLAWRAALRSRPGIANVLQAVHFLRQCRNSAVENNGAMKPLHLQLCNSTLRGVIRRAHFPLEVMLVCARWYAAYALSTRNLEEMMAERGVVVDQSTVPRWALKILSVLAKVFRRRQVRVRRSWRRDETYVRVGGQWKYLYRAGGRLGHTVDFLPTARRDEAAALAGSSLRRSTSMTPLRR